MNASEILSLVQTVVIAVAALLVVAAINRSNPGGLLQSIKELLTPKTKPSPTPPTDRWEPLKVDWVMIRKAVKATDFSTIDWTLRPGECCAGTGNEVVHPSGFICRKELVVNGLVSSFTGASEGHIPMLALRTVNLLAKPLTLYMNEVTIKGGRQAVQNCGPVQAAMGDAVRDAGAIGLLPKELAEKLVIVIDSFTHWMAMSDERIYNFTYYAMIMLIYRAVMGLPTVEDIEKSTDAHPYAGTKQNKLIDVAAIDALIPQEKK